MAWQKCLQPPAGCSLFEALPVGQQANVQRDHVLLHGTAAIGDASVSQPAASAAHWESLIQHSPNMELHKVLASDLLQKGEVALVELLRPLMIQRGFAPSEHISQAVERYLYEAMPVARRAALLECLDQVSAAVGVTVDVLYQFQTLALWARQRNCCLHPLGLSVTQLDRAAVAAARVTVSTSAAFTEVRDSTLLLVGILEHKLGMPVGPPVAPLVAPAAAPLAASSPAASAP